MNLAEQMAQLGRQAKAASRQLAQLTTDQKNAVLRAMADGISQNRASIQEANALDMESGAKSGLSSAMLDRLRLDDKRIDSMARGLRDVAALPDPVGRMRGLLLWNTTSNPMGICRRGTPPWP